MKLVAFVSAMLAAQIAHACAPIAGLDGLYAKGRIVLIGELHGTREMPALFGDFVCHALERGFTVRVGLEQSPAVGALLVKYLASRGDRAERVQVLAPRAASKDGTTSEAMADLFETLRTLSQATHRLSTFVFATKAADDAVYADNIAREQDPQTLTLVLIGNGHSTKKRDAPSDPPPVGEILRARKLDLRTVRLDFTRGTAFTRGLDGPGVHDRGAGDGSPPFATLRPAKPPLDDHDLAITVGEIHASPLAR